MVGTEPCIAMGIIFASVIKSRYTSLHIRFGANRTFYVPKTKYTDLTYMGGTGPCGPMKLIFGTVIKSFHTSLIIKFGANRTFHMPNIPVFRFDLYGRYQILWIDEANFW